ncbi:MAG: cell division protein FtsQ/DivIB [Sedimentisphaerales bacterium]
MAKKEKKSWFSRTKKLTKTEKKQRFHAVRTTIIIFAAIVVCVAVVVGFVFLDRYVKANLKLEKKTVPIHLLNFPDWGSEELKQKIVAEAAGDSKDLKLSDSAAMRIGENIAEFSWLYNTKVQIGNQAIVIDAQYRLPVALIKTNDSQYFIASDLVVLDYVNISKLPIVEITGVPAHRLTWRSVGTKWDSEDVVAAVELLALFARMDSEVVPDKPLLAEIKSIDMSNFNGRRSSSQPHIVLYAKDGTEIRWGAQKGAWQRYLEAKDEEKLTLLYNTYQELGTVQLRAAHKGAFIDLIKPQSLSLPIDRY